jgi:hypothetical protein
MRGREAAEPARLTHARASGITGRIVTLSARGQDARMIPHPNLCPLCRRPLPDGSSTDWHHLVPRSHGGTEQVRLHKICHQAIHAMLSEAELARDFASIEALGTHPGLARFITWVAKRPPDYQDRSRWSRERRRR